MHEQFRAAGRAVLKEKQGDDEAAKLQLAVEKIEKLEKEKLIWQVDSIGAMPTLPTVY